MDEKWKIMVITQDGIFFSANRSLTKQPNEATWLAEFAAAADRSADIVALNASGVTQVRIISSAFGDA